MGCLPPSEAVLLHAEPEDAKILGTCDDEIELVVPHLAHLLLADLDVHEASAVVLRQEPRPNAIGEEELAVALGEFELDQRIELPVDLTREERELGAHGKQLVDLLLGHLLCARLGEDEDALAARPLEALYTLVHLCEEADQTGVARLKVHGDEGRLSVLDETRRLGDLALGPEPDHGADAAPETEHEEHTDDRGTTDETGGKRPALSLLRHDRPLVRTPPRGRALLSRSKRPRGFTPLTSATRIIMLSGDFDTSSPSGRKPRGETARVIDPFFANPRRMPGAWYEGSRKGGLNLIRFGREAPYRSGS